MYYTIAIGKEPFRLLPSQLTVYNIQTLGQVTAPTLRHSITGAVATPSAGEFQLASAEGVWLVEGVPFAVAADKQQAKQQHNAWMAAKTRLIKKLQDEQKEELEAPGGLAKAPPPPPARPQSPTPPPPPSMAPTAAPPVAQSSAPGTVEVQCPKCGTLVPAQNTAIHALRCRGPEDHPQEPPSNPPPLAAAPPPLGLKTAEEEMLVQQKQKQKAADDEQRRQQQEAAEKRRRAEEAEALHLAAQEEAELQKRLMADRLAEQQRVKQRREKAEEQLRLLAEADERKQQAARRQEEQLARDRDELLRLNALRQAAEEEKRKGKQREAEQRAADLQRIDELKKMREVELERIRQMTTSRGGGGSAPPLSRGNNLGRQATAAAVAPTAGTASTGSRAVTSKLLPHQTELVGRGGEGRGASGGGRGISQPTAPAPPPPGKRGATVHAAAPSLLSTSAGRPQPVVPRRETGTRWGSQPPDIESDEQIARQLQRAYEDEITANDELVARALQERPGTGSRREDITAAPARARQRQIEEDERLARQRQIEEDERLARQLAEEGDDFSHFR
jgi:hypothetical protein